MMGKNAWDRKFGLSGLRLGGWSAGLLVSASADGLLVCWSEWSTGLLV